jgi:cytochrome c oxidase subunit 2
VLDFIYESEWGAFGVMLLFQIPFLLVFLTIVFRKAYVDTSPSTISDTSVSRWRSGWLTLAIALFLIINLASIKFFPTVYSARAAASGTAVIDVTVAAQSWYYDMSAQEFEAGKPVRFTVQSLDTVHGFAVYHPEGHILFTMMLIPGVGPSSLIYTFDEPGTYKVRCLEYCGMSHHDMSDEIIVTAAAS